MLDLIVQKCWNQVTRDSVVTGNRGPLCTECTSPRHSEPIGAQGTSTWGAFLTCREFRGRHEHVGNVLHGSSETALCWQYEEGDI